MRRFHEVRWSTTCGYYGCLPIRHSKTRRVLEWRDSSDSVDGISGAGTNETASPEKRKDEDLGWFLNPKGEYNEFSNSILLKFYLSFWTTFLIEINFVSKLCLYIQVLSFSRVLVSIQFSPNRHGVSSLPCQKKRTLTLPQLRIKQV